MWLLGLGVTPSAKRSHPARASADQTDHKEQGTLPPHGKCLSAQQQDDLQHAFTRSPRRPPTTSTAA